MVAGPWWWPSGQRSCLLLRRSEFESCWLLKLPLAKDKKNEKEARVGQSFKKSQEGGRLDQLEYLGLKDTGSNAVLMHWQNALLKRWTVRVCSFFSLPRLKIHCSEIFENAGWEARTLALCYTTLPERAVLCTSMCIRKVRAFNLGLNITKSCKLFQLIW